MAAGQVRLGVLEEHLGRGTVEQVVASCEARPVEQDEVLPRRRQQLMSLPLVARLVLAMTLLPQASYVEALAQLVGVLPRLPWARAWQVPSSTVVTAWRRRLGVDAMKAIFDRAAGSVVAATDPGCLWHGLPVAALDASRVGEQTLRARLIADHPHLFTPEYLYAVVI